MKAEYKEYYIKLGLKIAYYRKLNGLTQEQLAEIIGKNPAYVGHIEAPKMAKAISLDTLFDIARALGVPAHKFLDFD